MRVRSWNKTAILKGHFDCDPGLLKEGRWLLNNYRTLFCRYLSWYHWDMDIYSMC